MNDAPSHARRSSSIIIAVNPMPRLYIESLASTLLEHGSVKVLTFYRSTLFDAALVERLTRLGAELIQFTFTGRIDEFVKLRKAASLLRGWLKEPDVEVFHCQPNHFLTNYVTFGRPSRQGIRVNLIPDGVANFYETKTAPYERSMRAKKLIAPLAGLTFTPYSGDYLALDAGGYGKYWYFGNPGLMAARMTVQEFPAPTRSPEQIDARTLILGQPSSGTEDFEARYQELLTRIAALYPGAVYKPHPAERLDDSRSALLSLLGFSVVDTDLPAERLAATFSRVVGVASSVLFNVRLLGWNEDVVCVSDIALLMTLTARNETEISTILDSAHRLGIKSLDL